MKFDRLSTFKTKVLFLEPDNTCPTLKLLNAIANLIRDKYLDGKNGLLHCMENYISNADEEIMESKTKTTLNNDNDNKDIMDIDHIPMLSSSNTNEVNKANKSYHKKSSVMSSNSIANWSWTPHLTIAKTSADRKNDRKLKITKKDYEDLLTTSTTQAAITEEGNLNNNQPLTTLTQSISTSIQTSVIALNNNNTSSNNNKGPSMMVERNNTSEAVTDSSISFQTNLSIPVDSGIVTCYTNSSYNNNNSNNNSSNRSSNNNNNISRDNKIQCKSGNAVITSDDVNNANIDSNQLYAPVLCVELLSMTEMTEDGYYKSYATIDF